MESVIDKLIFELTSFKGTDYVDGGPSDDVVIEAIYWGDPGVIPAELYPCFTVSPVVDADGTENMGFERRNLEVTVSLLINASEFFNASVDEAMGDRQLVKTMGNLRQWLRRLAKRQLDGLEGVLETKVKHVQYTGQVRGSVIAKTATITLTVQKQYPKQN